MKRLITMLNYIQWMNTVFKERSTPSHIEPLGDGEEGYGPYKMIATDGHIMGYCGERYLQAIKRFTEDEERKMESRFDLDYPKRRTFNDAFAKRTHIHPLLR